MMFAYGFAAALAVATLVFGFNQSDPEVPKLVAVHAVSIVSFAWVAIQKKWAIPRAAFFVIGFYLWCGFSLLWSADWRGGAVEMANGTAYLGLFLMAALADRKKLEAIFPTIGLIAIATFIMARAWPQYYAGFGNENFEIEFALMLLPILLVGGWRYIPCIGLVAFIIVTNPSNIKWLALLACFLVCVGFIWRAGFRSCASIVTLCAVNFGLYKGILKSEELGHSVASRLELTTNTLAMWLNRPFNGNGVGSFNVLYPLYQEEHYKLFPWLGTIFSNDIADFAGAAHNEYAQVLSDYGLIGFAIVCMAAWFCIGSPRDRLDWAAYGALFFMAVCSLVGFPWQNVHTGALGAALVGIACNGRNVTEIAPKRFLTVAAACGAAWLLGFVSFENWKAQQHFSWTRGTIDKDPVLAVLENLNAYQEFSWPRHIRHQLAVSVAVAFTKDPGSIEIEPMAADKIFEISQTAGGRTSAIEIARIEYLIESGRASEKWQEIESRLAWLKTYAKLQDATWFMESKWALLTQDRERGNKALAVLDTMPNKLEGMRQMIALISQELNAED